MKGKVERRKDLAEDILKLSPDNQKVISKIVDEFLISETVKKLGVRPSEIKQILSR